MTFDAEMVQQVQRQADFLELRARQLELDAHHLRGRDGEGAGFHQQREADAIRALLIEAALARYEEGLKYQDFRTTMEEMVKALRGESND